MLPSWAGGQGSLLQEDDIQTETWELRVIYPAEKGGKGERRKSVHKTQRPGKGAQCGRSREGWGGSRWIHSRQARRKVEDEAEASLKRI